MEKTFGFNLEETLFWNALKKLIRFVMVTCSLAATGCIIYSCILRYIFHGNFYGSDEVILSFAFWLYFSGAMYGSYENSHIKADILMTMIKNLRVKDAFGLVAQLVNAAVNVILIGWAANYFIWGIEKMPVTTALKIPLVIPQSAIFFGLLIMGFYHIYYLYRNTRKYLRKGHFSIPQEGDYFSPAMLQKYPYSGIPSKEEAEEIRRKNETEEEAKGEGPETKTGQAAGPETKTGQAAGPETKMGQAAGQERSTGQAVEPDTKTGLAAEVERNMEQVAEPETNTAKEKREIGLAEAAKKAAGNTSTAAVNIEREGGE